MDSKKYICKFCKKSFPCGRSLGGHIRSHLIRGNVKSLNKQPKLLKSGSGPGYELRENPKKTNKATDLNLISSSYSISSWYTKTETEDGSDPNSGKRSGFIGGNNSNSSVSEVVEPDEEEVAVAMSLIILSRDISKFPDQFSGKISFDQAENKMKKDKNKMEKYQGKCSVLGASSKISCKKSEDLGVSGSGYRKNGSKIKEYEVSENGSAPNDQTNSVFSANNSSSAEKREKMKFSPSEHLQIVSKLKESEVSQNGFASNVQIMKPSRRKRKVSTPMCTKMGYLAFGEVEIGSKMKEFEVSENGYASNDSDKRSKFECTSCDKIFHSYQALGGHRASHKKLNANMKASHHPKPEWNYRKSMEKSHHLQQQQLGEIGIKVAQKHECPICFRVFPSGQALGGHKRSHLLASNTNANTNCINKDSNEIRKSPSSEMREFLDLNLAPTTQEEEAIPTSSSSNNLVGLVKPYWWVESHKHDLLLGLISN